MSFLTPPQQLLQHLTHLGYQPPKHLRPEHLDYLFRGEKNAALIRRLTHQLRPQHVLSPQEVARFEELEAEGVVVRGKELERGMAAKRVLQQGELEGREAERERVAQLKLALATKKKELAAMDRDMEVLRALTERKKEAAAERKVEITRLGREADREEIKAQVSKKRLQDKLSKLKEAGRQFLQILQLEGARLLCSYDWDEFLRREDRLQERVEQTISLHIPALVRASESLDDCSQERLEEERKIGELLEDEMDEAERLRHSVVYEKVKEFELKVRFLQEKVALSQIAAFLTRQRNLPRGKDHTILEREVEGRIGPLEETWNRTCSETIEVIKKQALEGVDGRYLPLIESNDRAKRRVENFIICVYEVLEAHKVRLDLALHVVSMEDASLQPILNRFTTLADQTSDFDIHADPKRRMERGLRERSVRRKEDEGVERMLCRAGISLPSRNPDLVRLVPKLCEKVEEERIAGGRDESRRVAGELRLWGREIGELREVLSRLRCSFNPVNYEVEGLKTALKERAAKLKETEDNAYAAIERKLAIKERLWREVEGALTVSS